MDFKRSAKTADDLRHAFCANDCAYPTPLEPELYDRAKREGFEMVGYYVRRMNRTLADALREEEAALHRRFVHATRPREPMSLEEARELAERMAWCGFCKKTHPDGATCMGHHP